MDVNVFKKMRVIPPCVAMVIYAPPGYAKMEGLNWTDAGQADFVHVFIEGREQFVERFTKAEKACKENGLLWVSYPKSKGKKTYDINRDSLWKLLLDIGFHPVSQVALNEGWSAVRVKRNEDGVIYEIPNKIKR